MIALHMQIMHFDNNLQLCNIRNEDYSLYKLVHIIALLDVNYLIQNILFTSFYL